MKLYKVAFVGSSGVGKTSIALETKRNRYKATILALHRKSLTVDSVVLAMDILDTSGSQEFVSIRDDAIKASDGFIVVYSIISGDSFKSISKMKNVIKALKGLEAFPVVLVANKLDLERHREVPRFEGETLAGEWGCPFFETFVSEERLPVVYEALVRQMNKSIAIVFEDVGQQPKEPVVGQKKECTCVII
ncbi:unnamed protein product [Candidula unifasciata]|uniref:Uncharacterized protein n=1 Tax=Candidula unifasciata TaxID=100452 RepID=A0A8S3YNL9_9EUPU|nr:unnamed protein product [Candidula unifasciata]